MKRFRHGCRDMLDLAGFLLPVLGAILLGTLLMPFAILWEKIRYADLRLEDGSTAHVLRKRFTSLGIYRYYVHPRTLDFPKPSRLSGRFYRLHDPKYCDEKSFWRIFLDADYKWEAEQRFASSAFNCGHFFGLAPEAALAESAFYEEESKGENKSMDKTQHTSVLVEIVATFPTILDLTDSATSDRVFGLFIGKEYDGSPYFFQLKYLTDEMEAGNSLTKDIGRWAWEHRYDGILFSSARAMEKAPYDSYQSYRDRITNPPNPNLDFTGADDIDHMQATKAIQNVVIFSGACLTSRIVKYRIDNGQWRRNPYCGISLRKLDKVLKAGCCVFDSAYQVQASDGLISRTGEFGLKPWSQRSGESRHRLKKNGNE